MEPAEVAEARELEQEQVDPEEEGDEDCVDGDRNGGQDFGPAHRVENRMAEAGQREASVAGDLE